MTASFARLVFPALRWRRDSFDHEAPKIRAALAAGVGGFILFGGTKEVVTALTAELRRAAGRPLLIGSDLERGAAQQFGGLTELPPPAALGFLDDPEITRSAAVITAQEARSVGVNWAFAPVCDLDLEPKNPIVQTRSFGADPARVSAHATAWIAGCQEHGVLACAKHYPGHGRTTRDSHETLPRVATPLAELERTDLAPFAAAVGGGGGGGGGGGAAAVGSVMSAFVAFPAWDPSGRAACFSHLMLGYLRERLGFAGLVVTDAFIMGGATASQAEPRAAVAAVAAGCDALLYPNDWQAVVAALDAAVGGAIPPARADEALARCERAAAEWSRGADQGEPDRDANSEFADGIADRALHLVRGAAPALGAGAGLPLHVAIVDDDVGGPYAVGPRDVFAGALREAGVSIGRRAGEGRRVVLVYAEARSWKGRADLGPRSRAALRRLAPGAALVVLFAHPRLAAQLPGEAAVLCAWHGQPLMQRAAARWLLARR